MVGDQKLNLWSSSRIIIIIVVVVVVVVIVVVVIIIIIIIIIFFFFIYGIHSYVPRGYTVAATLCFIVNTVYGAYLPHSYVGSDGLLRQHFPQNVCSA